MAGAPEGSTNARKGNENRIMFSTRLPVEIVKYIREESLRLKIAQSEFVMRLIECAETGTRLR